VDILVVEERFPENPAVLGLPESARSGTRVVGQGIPLDACNGCDPVSNDTDMPEGQGRELVGRKGLGS
jgi:hypothetical protein